jgi:GNAT superfamily N-acetyltransferase
LKRKEGGEVVAIEDTTAAGCPALARLERGDEEMLVRFFHRLSADTIYRRFLSPLARPEQIRLERLLDIDHRDREGIAAVLDGEIVGFANYARLPASDTAELAVVVADAWQRKGIATRLLSALEDSALASGIRLFALTMQADNRPALDLLRRFNPEPTLALAQGVYEATVSIGSGESR